MHSLRDSFLAWTFFLFKVAVKSSFCTYLMETAKEIANLFKHYIFICNILLDIKDSSRTKVCLSMYWLGMPNVTKKKKTRLKTRLST